MNKLIKDKYFKTILEKVLEPMILVNREGIIVFLNSAFEKMSGYSSEQLIGQSVEVLIPETLRARHVNLRSKYMLRPSVRPISMGINLHLRHKDGHDIPVDISLNPLDKEPELFIVIATFRETKFQTKTTGKMIDFIQHDPLTDLFTLDCFIDKLNYAISLFKNIKGLIFIFYIDIDDFKSINDTYGHQVGNQLLKLFSKRLLGVLREADVVARYGGDEFCCFAVNENTNLDFAEGMAKKILHTISQAFSIDDYQFSITASIGVSFFPTDGIDPTILLEKADKAMYEAKKKKNTYVVYGR